MKSRGFTLIEIIVSLAIFSVVAVIAIGALVRVTSANRQAQSIQSGVNNVSFIMDSMSRELRTATNISCYFGASRGSNGLVAPGSPCATNSLYTQTSDVLITFKSSNTDSSGGNLLYAYFFNGTAGATTTIYKGEALSSSDTITSLVFNPILSPSVNITAYNLGVFGGSTVTNPFSWLFVRLKGYVGTQAKDQSVFDVETSISQRSSNL